MVAGRSCSRGRLQGAGVRWEAAEALSHLAVEGSSFLRRIDSVTYFL